jgi:hypothetical protein
MPVDLNQIVHAVGLPIRRVRYVLEHRVLPGAEKASRGHRVARTFTGFEAFGIACATTLLEAGLRRPVVSGLIRALVKAPRGASALTIPFYKAYASRGPLKLEVADAANYRLIGPSLTDTLQARWLQIATGSPLDNAYHPLVVLSVDVGHLRDAIRRAARE